MINIDLQNLLKCWFQSSAIYGLYHKMNYFLLHACGQQVNVDFQFYICHLRSHPFKWIFRILAIRHQFYFRGNNQTRTLGKGFQDLTTFFRITCFVFMPLQHGSWPLCICLLEDRSIHLQRLLSILIWQELSSEKNDFPCNDITH